MKIPPLVTYLIPIIVLIGLVFLFKGSSDTSKKTESSPGKPDSVEKLLTDDKTTDKELTNGESDLESTGMNKEIQGRIPVYPNSQKAVLEEGMDITGASFYSSTDSADVVKEWYLEVLGGLMKVNMIDISDKNGKRTITLSLPDPPNELVEIQEGYMGTGDLLITITTVGFYTRNQPREYIPPDEKGVSK